MVTKLGYGTGHVLNDMCGSMWFTYMLLFFHNVIGLSNTNAGLIVLLGHIADGISTVLVGILSDQDHNIWIYIHYGKRKVGIIWNRYLFNITDWIIYISYWLILRIILLNSVFISSKYSCSTLSSCNLKNIWGSVSCGNLVFSLVLCTFNKYFL